MISRHQIQVFSQEWFTLHQAKLLYLFNHASPVVREKSRELCGIIRVPTELPLYKVEPYAYHAFLNRETLTKIVYSKPVIALEIYNNLNALWRLLHNYDLIANALRMPKKLNFGFDTLDLFSQTGEGGANTTTDGLVQKANQTWANIISGSGGGTDGGTGLNSYVELTCATTTNIYSVLRRLIFTYDTTLPPGATLTGATLILWGGGTKDNTLTGTANSSVVITGVTLGNNADINPSDWNNYSNWGTTWYSSMTFADVPTNAFASFVFNPNGLSAINTSGVTPLSARLSNDVTNTNPGWESGGKRFRVRFSFADASSGNPYFQITYSMPQTTRALIL